MSTVALAVVAAVVPDTKEFRSEAFSRAANSYLRNLLSALRTARLAPTIVLSFMAIPSVPRSNRFLLPSRRVKLEDGTPVRLMGFVNVVGLKQLWLGLSTLVRLCAWAAGPARSKRRVIYCFNLTVPPGVFVWAAARLTRSRVVVSLNDIAVPGESVPAGMRQRLDFWLQRRLIPRFDGHVAVADAIMHDFAPGREWVRLEGGVTDAQFSDPVADTSNLGHDRRFTVFLAGGLEEVNGVRLVVQAADEDTEGRIKWVIAGAGPLEQVVRQAAARNKNLTYLGFLGVCDLAAEYREVDLLLNIRLTQSINTRYFFPSKLIEYLATGTPVVTTATGHAVEEFGDFVFHLADETPAGLLHLIRQIAELPPGDRVDRGISARQYVRRVKHWDNHGRVLAAYLRRVAGGESMKTGEREAA